VSVPALLALDFLLVARRPHVVGLREAVGWSAIYIGVALAFTAVLWWADDLETATGYLTGRLVEKSLSVDNLFVFVIIMTRFQVPPNTSNGCCCSASRWPWRCGRAQPQLAQWPAAGRLLRPESLPALRRYEDSASRRRSTSERLL
jgi:hypothetical protein